MRGKPRRVAVMGPPSVGLVTAWEGVRGGTPWVGVVDGRGAFTPRMGVGARVAARSPRGGRRGHKLGGWGGVLDGGARRPREQVLEDRPSVGRGGKLRHVGDAGWEAQDGGAGAKQAPKPGRRVATGLVVVEGEEDPRAAPQGGGHPLKALRPQGGAGGQAPLRQDEPVEDALGDDRPRGAGPSRPRPSTGLGPGSDWNRGDRSGSMARPASQRTRPPATSGMTTMPAKRSPRSVNSPEFLSRSSLKPAPSRKRRSPCPDA